MNKNKKINIKYIIFFLIIIIFVIIILLYIYINYSENNLIIDDYYNNKFKFDVYPGSINIKLKRYCDVKNRFRTDPLIFNDEYNIYSPNIKFSIYYIGEGWNYKWSNDETIKPGIPAIIIFNSDNINDIYNSTTIEYKLLNKTR